MASERLLLMMAMRLGAVVAGGAMDGLSREMRKNMDWKRA